MSKINITLAWKDPSYLESLSEAERAQIPANPAGEIELSDSDLASIAGGLAAPGGTGTGGGTCVCTSTGTGTGESCVCYCD